jgi:hypothetical protein
LISWVTMIHSYHKHPKMPAYQSAYCHNSIKFVQLDSQTEWNQLRPCRSIAFYSQHSNKWLLLCQKQRSTTISLTGALLQRVIIHQPIKTIQTATDKLQHLNLIRFCHCFRRKAIRKLPRKSKNLEWTAAIDGVITQLECSTWLYFKPVKRTRSKSGRANQVYGILESTSNLGLIDPACDCTQWKLVFAIYQSSVHSVNDMRQLIQSGDDMLWAYARHTPHPDN